MPRGREPASKTSKAVSSHRTPKTAGAAAKVARASVEAARHGVAGYFPYGTGRRISPMAITCDAAAGARAVGSPSAGPLWVGGTGRGGGNAWPGPFFGSSDAGGSGGTSGVGGGSTSAGGGRVPGGARRTVTSLSASKTRPSCRRKRAMTRSVGVDGHTFHGKVRL